MLIRSGRVAISAPALGLMDEAKVGRPSLFKEEYTQMLLDYFGEDPYREILKKITTKSGDIVEIPVDVAADFPSLAGFAIKVGVHRDTLHEWSKVHPEFSDAYKRAKDFQENFLLVNSLKGLVPPASGIFIMKNVIGFRDKQPGEEDTIIVNNFNQKSDADLDARAIELVSKLGIKKDE